jgi:hypothetical protein
MPILTPTRRFRNHRPTGLRKVRVLALDADM